MIQITLSFYRLKYTFCESVFNIMGYNIPDVHISVEGLKGSPHNPDTPYTPNVDIPLVTCGQINPSLSLYESN